MKIVALILMLFFSHADARKSAGYHKVRPHVTRKGKFIATHQRTNPRKYLPRDNWSSKGNQNPLNSKKGYTRRDK